MHALHLHYTYFSCTSPITTRKIHVIYHADSLCALRCHMVVAFRIVIFCLDSCTPFLSHTHPSLTCLNPGFRLTLLSSLLYLPLSCIYLRPLVLRPLTFLPSPFPSLEWRGKQGREERGRERGGEEGEIWEGWEAGPNTDKIVGIYHL